MIYRFDRSPSNLIFFSSREVFSIDVQNRGIQFKISTKLIFKIVEWSGEIESAIPRQYPPQNNSVEG